MSNCQLVVNFTGMKTLLKGIPVTRRQESVTSTPPLSKNIYLVPAGEFFFLTYNPCT